MASSEHTDRAREGTHTIISIIAWVVLIFTVYVATLSNWGAGAFSPDSWAYFELSQTIGNDFYRIKHLRSYWTENYSAAFPPLWPALIFVANAVFNLGPDIAILLNVVILLLIAAVADSIAKATFSVSGPGVLMALVLLLHPGFFGELVAGRSIPLFILLGLTALRLIIAEDAAHKTFRFAALGAVLAAMFMTRFDGALWVIVLFPFMLTLKPGTHGLLAFWAAYAAGVSPWITYSMTRFDLAIVSDNSWVARALDRNAFVTDYPPAQGPTIADDPAFVFDTVIGRIPDLLAAAARSPGRLGLLVFLILLVLLLLASPWRRLSFAGLGSSRALPFIAVGLAIASASPSYLLTGYFDGRYFSFPFAFVVFLILVGVWTGARLRTFVRVFALAVSISVVAIAPFLALGPGRNSAPQIDLPHESELAACLGLEPNHPPILGTNPTQAARLTALYGIRTAFLPNNFARGASDPAVHEAFLSAYQIEYALDPSGSAARVFGAQRLSSVPGCGLDIYRMLPLETP